MSEIVVYKAERTRRTPKKTQMKQLCISLFHPYQYRTDFRTFFDSSLPVHRFLSWGQLTFLSREEDTGHRAHSSQHTKEDATQDIFAFQTTNKISTLPRAIQDKSIELPPAAPAPEGSSKDPSPSPAPGPAAPPTNWTSDPSDDRARDLLVSFPLPFPLPVAGGGDGEPYGSLIRWK
jgi:hypothetical protein